MKPQSPAFPAPLDADARRAAPAVICYPTETLPQPDLAALARRREGAVNGGHVIVPPRDARCIDVPAGSFFRITCPDGPQVGDLNLWSAQDLTEHFYSGKTRALHGTHLSTGDRLWSRFPAMRPMATITRDTLDWYGWDADGGSVHDVIGTRCDPYTGRLLGGVDYHYCCHSNLTRALADHSGLSLARAEPLVHDVLNVFMCTGFTADTHQYFMKASPVRAGDYLEFFAEIDLIVGLSACPGGDCGDEHTSDKATCSPLRIDVFESTESHQPVPQNAYDRSHGR
ncbi:urea carboxylase-associated family protein [Thalassorhabdomicrobium marinisediminis]|uniref:DUF1989 domain-containing protein n=1 Tax=Thalassorhabdomicrobium marinisediminis TaxID=2170577 RepID=A0A2T7G0J4_9RHOB|nr:DUF1989 domain-containing protein [Thalassorhabdomicrobium marinisediminis]PVA07931.1 hypothetical protein DC363_00050 [Thalassorhabdomicrobium marinisediminis]